MDEDLPESVRRALTAFLPRIERRGYVTYDELNAVLPSREYTSREIEAVLHFFSERGIDTVAG